MPPHRLAQSNVIEQDGGPRNEHASGGEVDEPEEDGEGAGGERHEGEEHEASVETHAHPGYAPGGRAQEDGGGLPFDGEAVEDAGPG